MTPHKMLPAEWQPQSGIMLTWPHKQTDFAGELSRVERVFCELAIAISQSEQIIICSSDDEHTSHIIQLLTQTSCNLKHVHIFPVPSNDSWARDHGPITIIEDDKPVLLDFTFNGWGNKFPHHLDDAITAKLTKQDAFNPGLKLKPIDFVLDGGSIESDGKGTLLTTSQCLLTESRNPDLNRAQIETVLKESLGVNRVLWLEHGQLLGDDTDSHIDMLARFISEDSICYMKCKNKGDPHYHWLSNMELELQAFRMADGEPYRLVELPFPSPIIDSSGQRLPASYCNFLITNNTVLVPVYDCPQDTQAMEILTDCYPQNEVVPIDCRALIEQHGSLHCITMQLPAGVLVG